MKNAKSHKLKSVIYTPFGITCTRGKSPENKEGFYGIFYKFRDAFV